jgi:uncharacterized protein (TIRG00374 family)
MVPGIEMDNGNDTPVSGNGRKLPALWGWHSYLSILITVAVFAVLAHYVDFERVWQEMAGSNKHLLLLAALAHYATYPVRGVRWKRCLNHLPVRCGYARFGLLVFFYNFVDNLVPAKLGDLYASHLVRINCGVRRSAALGSILFLRTLDAWILLCLAAVTSWVLFAGSLPASVTWALIGGCVLAVVATAMMLIFIIFKRSLPAWFPETVKQLIGAFQSAMWPKPKETMPVAALTIVIWALETLWIYLLVRGFGVRLNGTETVFVTMIPLIASAFPFTPSGAGVVELSLFSCLRLVGVSSPLAVSLTVVNRFIDYWLHILLGSATWLLRTRFGMHSWREVPLEDRSEPSVVELPVGKEKAA